MRRTLAALAAVPVITLAACSSGGTPAPAATLPAAEQAAVSGMAAYCTEDAAQLASMVAASHGLEVKAGVTGESVTQMAQHLLTVVSANKSPVSCVQEFAAYVTMREGGS